MTLHEFTKEGIENMYTNVLDEVYKALDDGTIANMTIDIQIGNQLIKVPLNADFQEYIFEYLKYCQEDKDRP